MERQRKHATADLIEHTRNMEYILAFEGIFVGVIAGSLAIVYRLAMACSEATLTGVLTYGSTHHGAMVAWFALLAVMGVLVGSLVKWEPLISGSGIPQVEGELQGCFKAPWHRVIIGKLIGGILCMFGGLSLGREGPSVQLGAMGGKGFAQLLRRFNIEERYLITCGASAGLAAAFNAPLAGTIFALEEIHKNFSASILFSAMTASVTADFVSKYVFGLKPVFHFAVDGFIPLEDYWLVILLGLLLGAAGVFYNAVLLQSQVLYGRIKGLKTEFRPVVPFLLAGVLGLLLPQVLGGGNMMVQLLGSGQLALSGMLLLLVVKFLFSMVSFGSGAPGGIFFPLLVLGAYLGAIYGTAVTTYLGIDPALVNNFIIIAMAGYFTAIVRAPITGIVLITEMTGSFDHLLALSVVAITAELTAGLLHGRPVYDCLLERILANRPDHVPSDSVNKILLSQKIRHNAQIDNQTVAAIPWPDACLLISVMRHGREIIPNGATVLHAQDTIVALADEKDSQQISAVLRTLCAEPRE